MTDPLTPAQQREDIVVLRECYEGDLTSTNAVRIVQLCATVEAQAEVIARLRDGWRAITYSNGRGWWTKYDALRGDDGVPDEPLARAHQLVLWGEVVREESDG